MRTEGRGIAYAGGRRGETEGGRAEKKKKREKGTKMEYMVGEMCRVGLAA